MARPPPLKLFFDGGCRPNPGAIEVAVVVRGKAHVFADLGHGSRLDAEWLALIKALEIARSLPERDVILLGDAADVIAQASGRQRCRGASQRHWQAFQALVADQAPPRLRHVGRAQNLAGIALAKRHPR